MVGMAILNLCQVLVLKMVIWKNGILCRTEYLEVCDTIPILPMRFELAGNVHSSRQPSSDDPR
jgi:hypothetical protein